MEVEFNVFTDFNQFVIFDSAADRGDLNETWTDETIQSMFVQGDGYIAVGTMRAFDAPVMVRLVWRPRFRWAGFGRNEIDHPRLVPLRGEVSIAVVNSGPPGGADSLEERAARHTIEGLPTA